MAISDRIQAMYTHTSDIYDSVELTGVDTTDIDKNLVNVPNTLKEGYIDIINNGTDTLYNNFPKVSGEGTSLTLNNTYQAPMRNNLKGNTSQTGTPTPENPIPVNVVSGDNEIVVSGKNLLPTPYTPSDTFYNGLTFIENSDGSITINGTATATTYFILIRDTNQDVLKNDVAYTLSGGTPNLELYFNGGPSFDTGNGVTFTYTTSITRTRLIGIRITTGKTTNQTIYPMLVKGTSKATYEPYQGNTYNIDLPVENKIQIKTDLNVTQNGLQFKYESDGAVSITGTANSTTDYYIPLQSNIVLNNNIYTFSCMCDGSIGANDGSIRFIASGGISFGNTFKTLVSNSQVYITAQNTTSNEYKFCLFSFVSGKIYNIKLYFQLEKGSKANSYTPYGTTPIELCKIGNYQDYFYKDSDKWYLHKEIGKYTFTGNESITLSQTADVFYINNAYTNALINDVSTPLCTIFQGAISRTNASTASNNPNNSVCLDKGTNKRFYFHTNVYSTTTDLATGLTGQSIYWIYETPTNTEITDTTLINQLEEFYQAQSKNNQTNISQINNDLPFIISASALKKG